MPELLLEWEITRHSTASWWKMYLCFLGILEHKQGLAPVPVMVPCSLSVSLPFFLKGNPAYLRFTQASVGRTSQLTSFPHFVNFFLSLDPSTFNSLQDRRNLMLFRNTLCGFLWASIDRKLVLFKTSRGAWMLLHGRSVLLGLWNIPMPDLLIFEDMQLSSEREGFSSTEGRRNIFCAQGKFLLSDQHDRLHLGLGAAQTYGELLSTQCACNPTRLVLAWQASSPPLEV